MRCFFEINIPQDIKERIAIAAENLTKINGVNWVKKENMHVTLAFLGEVPEKNIEEIIEKASGIICKKSQFNCVIETIESVPQKNPRLVWIALKQNKSLSELHVSFKKAFKLEETEKNVFIGHITLGRIKCMKTKEDVHKLAEGIKNINEKSIFPLEFMAREANLMKSVLKPEGSDYMLIKTIKLRELE